MRSTILKTAVTAGEKDFPSLLRREPILIFSVFIKLPSFKTTCFAGTFCKFP